MENRTQGAWIIHHTKKLSEVKSTQDFEDIELAGKCGIFLSNLAASDEQSDLSNEKVQAIAKISDIKKTEIDSIKKHLSNAHLIDLGRDGSISVLGITSSSVLSHTSDIFRYTNPTKYQEAALSLSEQVSDLPKEESLVKEYISDSYQLPKTDTNDLFGLCEEIGFVDYEAIGGDRKLYFNGNLFRKDTLKKTDAVLGSLKPDDCRKIAELDSVLSSSGCVSQEFATNLLGHPLFEKLQSIGMYDVNEVSNPNETKAFITKPSAFAKFGNPFEEDALDLAKAFVSSLYYGINYSSQGRGKITMLKALMKRLVNGYEIGPATAIGQDYRLLELKRVIKLRSAEKGMFFMKLLKKDVGELALQVLEIGDATEQAVVMSSVGVSYYLGPEQTRNISRKRQNPQSKKGVIDLLRTFRS